MKLILLPGWSFGEIPSLELTGMFELDSINLYELERPLTFSNISEQIEIKYKDCDEKLVLFGWSMGGSVCLEILRRGILDITGLVLISSTPCYLNSKTDADSWSMGMNRGIAMNLRRKLIRDCEGTVNYFRKLCFAGAEGYSSSDFCPVLEDALVTLDELYAADYRKELLRVKCPTLILHGDSDNICSVSAGKCLSQNILGSQFTVFKEAAHTPFVDEKSAFRSVLEVFISEL